MRTPIAISIERRIHPATLMLKATIHGANNRSISAQLPTMRLIRPPGQSSTRMPSAADINNPCAHRKATIPPRKHPRQSRSQNSGNSAWCSVTMRDVIDTDEASEKSDQTYDDREETLYSCQSAFSERSQQRLLVDQAPSCAAHQIDTRFPSSLRVPLSSLARVACRVTKSSALPHQKSYRRGSFNWRSGIPGWLLCWRDWRGRWIYGSIHLAIAPQRFPVEGLVFSAFLAAEYGFAGVDIDQGSGAAILGRCHHCSVQD